MGVRASDGRFIKDERRVDGDHGDWQNMSIEVSKSVILEGSPVNEAAAALRMPLKTLSLHQKDICLSLHATLAPGVR
jgi:hypothetical protein